MSFHRYLITRRSGFTLIEMLVAVSIFSIILLISTRAFSSFVSLQKGLIGEQRIQEDLRVILEMMAREVRTGYGSTFEANADLSAIAFVNQEGDCVQYALTPSAGGGHNLTRASRRADIGPCWSGDYGLKEAINQAGTDFDQLKFFVQPAAVDGAGQKLLNQGLVTIVLRAHAREKSGSIVDLETSVASRQTKPFVFPTL